MDNQTINSSDQKVLSRLRWAMSIAAGVSVILFTLAILLSIDVYHATKELVVIMNNQSLLIEMDADVQSSLAHNYMIGRELCHDAYDYYEETTDKEFKYVFERSNINEEEKLEDTCAKLYALAESYPKFEKAIHITDVKEMLADSVADINDAVRVYNELIEEHNKYIDIFNNRFYCKITNRKINKESPMQIIQ